MTRFFIYHAPERKLKRHRFVIRSWEKGKYERQIIIFIAVRGRRTGLPFFLSSIMLVLFYDLIGTLFLYSLENISFQTI